MKNETREISEKSSMLWAKTSRDSGLDWLPIHVHMRDSTFVCSVLWDDWIPANTKKRIVDGIRINSENIAPEEYREHLPAGHYRVVKEFYGAGGEITAAAEFSISE